MPQPYEARLDRLRADLKAALVGNHCTSPDGTMMHAPTSKVLDIAALILDRINGENAKSATSNE